MTFKRLLTILLFIMPVLAFSQGVDTSAMSIDTAAQELIDCARTGVMEEGEVREVLIEDDRIVFGLLMALLGFVFWSSSSNISFFKKFYKVIPALFACYFLPAILSSLGIVSPEVSGLYGMAKNYLLPAALILMTLSIDMKALVRLGPKALIMFATATVGIIIGGPIALAAVGSANPEVLGGPEECTETWRGLSTLAGSWIGGGANQTAMYEVYKFKEELYGQMILVDIVVANLWMMFLLLGVGKAAKIDKWLKADTSAIEALKTKVETFQKSVARIPDLKDIMIIAGVVFGGVGLSHFLANQLSEFFGSILADPEQSTLASSFFWLVVFSTIIGFSLSLTKARKLEGAGASKFGSVFIYILVATIGMKMDVTKIFDNPSLFLVGLLWMAIHVVLLVLVAKLIRAPYFFLAVGSKANIGGAASAPVVAGAFHPSLASVGMVLAVFGYAAGTGGAYLCAEMMRMVTEALG